MLFVFGDQLSHFSLSEENKICLCQAMNVQLIRFQIQRANRQAKVAH
ncbi:hypothetical protein DOZ52_29565 [Enterobacter hormaechei]|nr:hypothetical protein DOZ52_29565 [Enterobacter hormaechei]